MTRQQPVVQGGPTVGDTLTVVHRVSAPYGALVQPRELTDSLVATLVGVPRVEREGDSVRIAYTIAVWSPGEHELTIPGALVIIPGGTVDTLPDATVQLRIRSVLPADAKPDTLTPQQARPWIPRAERTATPFLMLLVPMLLLFGALAWWWRRRGPTEAAVAAPPMSRVERLERLRRWLDAGEVTLVVDHLGSLVPGTDEGMAWREAVAAVRFDGTAEARLRALAEEGLALVAGDTVSR
ncbi:MAG TPA: hypothetical protein VFN22_13205 [Gemmatimonadales bacterium]|nr:hypothetical protein [Gemmatimonadales bacterium]